MSLLWTPSWLINVFKIKFKFQNTAQTSHDKVSAKVCRLNFSDAWSLSLQPCLTAKGSLKGPCLQPCLTAGGSLKGPCWTSCASPPSPRPLAGKFLLVIQNLTEMSHLFRSLLGHALSSSSSSALFPPLWLE